MGKVVVTGAGGFVGRSVCPALVHAGHSVRVCSRRAGLRLGADTFLEYAVVDDLLSERGWMRALAGMETIVHLAGIAYARRPHPRDRFEPYRRVNVEGTAELISRALRAGVKRLIYLSSLKVNGELTSRGPFTAADEPHPSGPYAQSKWEAEQLLTRAARETGLEVVIVRAPLVYGPGVKGNFRSLLRLVDAGVPLPLGGVTNRRSLIGIDNLCDILAVCVDHPQASGQTFLVSDNEDLSTPELIRRLGDQMHRPVRLFGVPVSLMRHLGRLIGRKGLVERLCYSLQADIGETVARLRWTPPYCVTQGLHKTVEWYQRRMA